MRQHVILYFGKTNEDNNSTKKSMKQSQTINKIIKIYLRVYRMKIFIDYTFDYIWNKNETFLPQHFHMNFPIQIHFHRLWCAAMHFIASKFILCVESLMNFIDAMVVQIKSFKMFNLE